MFRRRRRRRRRKTTHGRWPLAHWQPKRDAQLTQSSVPQLMLAVADAVAVAAVIRVFLFFYGGAGGSLSRRGRAARSARHGRTVPVAHTHTKNTQSTHCFLGRLPFMWWHSDLATESGGSRWKGLAGAAVAAWPRPTPSLTRSSLRRCCAAGEAAAVERRGLGGPLAGLGPLPTQPRLNAI